MEEITNSENPTENVNFQSRINLEPLLESINTIKQELGTVIVGQSKMIDQLLVAILSNGHVLLEGVPGVAKTITAKLLSKTLNIGFSRIQFTPDLMPSDILGTSVFDLKKSEFEFKKGPIFSNLILIDEINRAPAKTQAALFEVMEERQITIDGTSYILDTPFSSNCHPKPNRTRRNLSFAGSAIRPFSVQNLHRLSKNGRGNPDYPKRTFTAKSRQTRQYQNLAFLGGNQVLSSLGQTNYRGAKPAGIHRQNRDQHPRKCLFVSRCFASCFHCHIECCQRFCRHPWT